MPVMPRSLVRALLFPLLLVLPAHAAQGQAASLTARQQALRAIYRELVEINTVDSVGSVTKAAQAMAKRFRDAGFPARDIHLLVPPGKPTKGNLVVRYRGHGAGKPILLLAHLDVVAALRSDWTVDPFTLGERDGYFYGRGTGDDKAMASIFVANLIAAKQAGWVPDRDVILALTADEEGGEANGVEYLIANHRDLVDAAYAINEGGGGTLLDGRPIVNNVQAAEKVPVNFTVTARNAGGHSSVPRPDNAIYALVGGLGRLARFQFPVQLNEVTRVFFERSASLERPPLGAAMHAIVANPADSAAAATLSSVPRYNSILRTTCVATRLAGGHAYNALPQTASANVNCRIVPTQSLEDVRGMIAQALGDTSLHITLTVPLHEKFGVAPSPLVPELMDPVAAITQQVFGASTAVIPFMSTGATDGRFLRAAGIPTYGVSGIFSDPADNRAHGRDERMLVKSLYDGQEFLRRLMERLATVAPRA